MHLGFVQPIGAGLVATVRRELTGWSEGVVVREDVWVLVDEAVLDGATPCQLLG